MPEITIDIDAEEEVDFFPEIPEDEELEIELPEFFDNNKLSVGGESSHKRDRTISESVRMKSLPKSPSRSDMMMKRNRSTPGLGRLARLDSINDQREVMKVLDSYNNRRNSSYLVYEVQVKNLVKLQSQLISLAINQSYFTRNDHFTAWITTSVETFGFETK